MSERYSRDAAGFIEILVVFLCNTMEQCSHFSMLHHIPHVKHWSWTVRKPHIYLVTVTASLVQQSQFHSADSRNNGMSLFIFPVCVINMRWFRDHRAPSRRKEMRRIYCNRWFIPLSFPVHVATFSPSQKSLPLVLVSQSFTFFYSTVAPVHELFQNCVLCKSYNHYTCCHWWQPHIVIACFSFASCPLCS